jgi:cysteine desulfurase/selenocysteine lyase
MNVWHRTGRTTSDWSRDFGPFNDEWRRRIWLNAAHQGPLPHVAIDEAQHALWWKVAPHRIPDEAFTDVPRRLRSALGQLINAPPEEIILGNSASYGLQLLANGIRWHPGDEVLVLADDFPATIHPWFVAQRHGVRTRLLKVDDPSQIAERLASALTPSTRVVSISWVQSFTGHILDLEKLGRVCLQAGVALVVNATQGLGRLPFDVASLSPAAVTASGAKWLCGPYGTGFSWIRADILEGLDSTQSYWLARPDGAELDLSEGLAPALRHDLGARAYDVFGTANFLNFMPWAASVEYLLAQGIEGIAAHGAALVDLLVGGIADAPYELISPSASEDQSGIVVITHIDKSRNEAANAALSQAGIDIAIRTGRLRISPHLYNTPEEIGRALECLGHM